MRALLRLGNLLSPKFPYEVCKAVACDGLPRLLGRAEAEMVVDRGSASKPLRLTLMLDGYSAPITAGNFADLVCKGSHQAPQHTCSPAPSPLCPSPNAPEHTHAPARPALVPSTRAPMPPRHLGACPPAASPSHAAITPLDVASYKFLTPFLSSAPLAL
jgi:hypothetical protein